MENVKIYEYPPRLAIKLMEKCADYTHLDCLIGDLEEEYQRLLKSCGSVTKANLWFWRQSISVVLSFKLKPKIEY